MKLLKLMGLAVLVFVLALTVAFSSTARAQEGGGGDGWTQEYDCDYHDGEMEHQVEEGSTHESGSTHGWWPGDCGVHAVD